MLLSIGADGTAFFTEVNPLVDRNRIKISVFPFVKITDAIFTEKELINYLDDKENKINIMAMDGFSDLNKLEKEILDISKDRKILRELEILYPKNIFFKK